MCFKVWVVHELDCITSNKLFDIHESVHRDTIKKVTNKMQLHRLIYYT